jgi:spore maturation protein SpmB
VFFRPFYCISDGSGAQAVLYSIFVREHDDTVDTVHAPAKMLLTRAPFQIVTLVFGFICISNFGKGLAVALREQSPFYPFLLPDTH